MAEDSLPTVPRQLVFGHAGIEGIAGGVALLSRLIRLGYGPRGGRVMLERPFDTPLHGSDAERICRGFELDGALPNIGAGLVRELQLRTRRAAGDGGATATILFDALLRDGLRLLAAGTEPRALARGVAAAAAAAVARLQAGARPLRGPAGRLALARSIAGQDALAGLLAEAAAAAGRQGAILVEASRTGRSGVEVEPGFRLARGYVSAVMAADTLRLQTRLVRPEILVASCPLTRPEQVAPLLERARRRDRSLLLVAEAVEGAALAVLNANSVRRTVDAVAVRAPGHAGERRALLEDLAATVGAQLVEAAGAADLADALGGAEEALVGKDRTVIGGPHRDPQRVRQRLREIEALRAGWPTEHERELLDRRQASLAGRTAILRIGGESDPAAGEALERAENAARAFRSALYHGVLPGGGAALVRAGEAIGDLALSGEAERRGAALVRRALHAPARQLLVNAGIPGTEQAAILDRYAQGRGRSVYDPLQGGWRQGRVLDSAPALCAALQVAASTATLLLTASVVVTDSPAGA